jgi:hypothetical protein
MKPILCNTEMVRAILEGLKTVTRRVVKPQPVHESGFWKLGGAAWSDNLREITPFPCHTLYNRAPYHPRDILYVRETWTVWDGNYEYKADVDDGYGPFCSNCTIDICTGYCNSVLKWRPSIHMPREAARIFLRVTDVRVERLQEMPPYDIAFEGFRKQKDFIALWNSTIKPSDRAIYGWDANPWVWVIEFERISREEAISDV